MDKPTTWRHIHEERRAMATTLAGLAPDQWEAPSLCAGWSVKDVAAHVIAHPQTGWAQLAPMLVRNLGRGYNTIMFREVKRLGTGATPASVLADFATYDTSLRKVPTTTVVDPLIDVLVHHQDVTRALGLHREMSPVAAAVAADRARTLAFLNGSREVVRSTRMVATDLDWVRGRGPTIEGPMQELLMVCMGRARVAQDLVGDGLELVST
ncbi:maleylpyruvate isomerase family mycothiol-dependent enzyme [Nocardioides piscis]|uniref:Maleylpyruvate isomerase family mycothiol-dependent enzyme n=1 Tax=Nocardioides piscis TaxID=2714938 RepID=A0A6G7YBY1_9ACTN|nr:maleylpyruvate isomerase family mycothiol-dependent enzyme [Nocardioides piscis]QIK74270.1 maleylpyruvate isomerase family mycothiol-dependent enzyme [Nocardioides piscis]